MVTKQLIKKTIYPRPHDIELKWTMNASILANQCFSIPLITADEGQGDPASYNAHPQHASFAEKAMSHCYPDSVVNSINCKIVTSLLKHAWNTDKIETMMVGYMPFFMSFINDYTAKDELSGVTSAAILEMQKEDTDRQGYPIFNATDATGDLLVVGADQLGNTASELEGITFDMKTFQDLRAYGSNSGHLRQLAPKMHWRRVTKYRPATFKLNLKVNSKVKRMNPYTYCGVIIYVPDFADINSLNDSADDTTGEHLQHTLRCRYNEWNENFDMNRT